MTAVPATRAAQARRFLQQARSWLVEQWQDFRRQSKYFQYRVYIIGGYLALLAVTIVAVMPKTQSNSLKAYVLAARGDFVVGSYILVRNDSGHDWTDVIVTVNGTHTYVATKLATGDRLAIRLKQLSGQTALEEHDVRSVDIQCSRGHETYEVAFPRRTLGQ